MIKVLILGIGFAQKDALMYLKSNNFYTIGCSNIGSGPGFDYCDKFYLADIKDIHAVTNIAKKENVDLIYSIGSDIAMPTVNTVSEALGLPHFITSSDAINMHHKDKMREVFGNKVSWNIRYIKYSKANDNKDKWNIFPCIVKPSDAQGQRGVNKANDTHELEKFAETALNYSPSKEVIIEEFIEGQEYSLNGYIKNGVVTLSFITKRVSYSNFPGGIIKKHIYENVDYSWEKEMETILYSIIKKFRILNGPLYIQFIVTSENKIKIVEITPRFDGCHLWRLIKLINNIDFISIAFNHLMNNYSTIKERHRKNTKLMYELEFLGAKSSSMVSYLKRSNEENYIYYEEYYNDGHIVKPTNGYIEKTGYFIKEVKC